MKSTGEGKELPGGNKFRLCRGKEYSKDTYGIKGGDRIRRFKIYASKGGEHGDSLFLGVGGGERLPLEGKKLFMY